MLQKNKILLDLNDKEANCVWFAWTSCDQERPNRFIPDVAHSSVPNSDQVPEAKKTRSHQFVSRVVYYYLSIYK
jgi:hypothetical protein